MKVVETAVKEVECERAQKPRFQVRPTLLPKRRTTSSTTWTNLATKKAATKWIKQAVAEPIMARLNSFRPDSTRSPRKRDGIKKDVSDRDTRMKRWVSAGAAEAEKFIKESAQSTRKLGVNGSERKSRACTESHLTR